MNITGWNVHVGTAGMTVVRLAGRSGEGAGWPLPRLLSDLDRLGLERDAAPRAVGSGSGPPLIHAADLRWRGCSLYAEVRHLGEEGSDELTLELPAWDELEQTVGEEARLWELVDAAAAATSATHGCLGDGEALEPEPPRDAQQLAASCRSHAGVLVRDTVELRPRWLAAEYMRLPESGLVLLLH